MSILTIMGIYLMSTRLTEPPFLAILWEFVRERYDETITLP